MSNVTPIAGNALSNVFSEFSQFAISNLEVLKGGNGNTASDVTEEHVDF